MSGFPLARVANTRSGWIYTLYSRGESNAFIHALDTRHRVARCIDLPWKGAAQNVLQRAVLSLEHGKLMLRQPRGDLLAAIDLRSFGVTT